VASKSPLTEPAWLRGLRGRRIVSGAPVEASGVCHDSRAVVPGVVFVAIAGLGLDGNRFIPEAIARGAGAIIVQESLRPLWQAYAAGSATFVAVPDARIALAEAAAAFHGYPARSLGTIGVTGTDGKTSTTHLIAHVLNQAGLRCGSLSSVEFGSGGQTEPNASHMTTLEADEVQRHLARVRDAGGATPSSKPRR
jgi:UDP-N-acetylmuramyl tripeptide synthase